MKKLLSFVFFIAAIKVSSQNVVNIAGTNPFTMLKSMGGLSIDSGLYLTPMAYLNSTLYDREGKITYFSPTNSVWFNNGISYAEFMYMLPSQRTITTLPGIGQTVNTSKDFVNLFFGSGTGSAGGGTSLTTVNTMSTLRNTTSTLGTEVYVQGFYVPGDGGGGDFMLTNTSVTDTVPGMRVVAGGSGLIWVRVYEGNKFNYKWFGAVGDSITYNKYLQTAMDYVSTRYPGGTLFVPNGKYRDTSHALLRSNINIEGESMYGAVLFNDLKIYAGSKLQYQNPIRMGNLTPGDWDTTTQRYYNFDSVINYGNKIVLHNMPDSFYVGKICIVIGTTFFTQHSGVNKFNYCRVVEVTRRVLDTIYLGHPLDSVLVVGKIGAVGDYLSANKDPYLFQKRFVVRSNISNITLKSVYGQVAQANARYECHMTNVHTYGWELPFGNGVVWCKYSNIHAEFAKKVFEAAVGSHDDILTNIHANFFIMDSVLVRPAQPIIKFGESVYDIKVSGLTVDAGNFNGKGICFYAAQRCGIDNFLIVGRNMKSTLAQMSTSVATQDDDSTESGAPTVVDYNYLTNGSIIGGYNGQLFQYINFQRYVNGGELAGNRITNVTFQGQVTQQALNLDGRDEYMNNLWCENGKISYGDSAYTSSISNSYIGDFDLSYNYPANIRLSNITSRAGALNRGQIYSFVSRPSLGGVPGLGQTPMSLWADTTGGVEHLYYKQSSNLTTDILRLGGGGGGSGAPTTIERTYPQTSLTNWVGTAPSGTYLGVYRIDTLNSNTVTVVFTIRFSSSGTSVTGVDMALPSDVPIPFEPSPANVTGDVMYIGNANMSSTGSLSVSGKIGLLKTGTGTYKFQIVAAGSVARIIQATITYNY